METRCIKIILNTILIFDYLLMVIMFPIIDETVMKI